MRTVIVALLLGTALAVPATAQEGADQLVKALYKLESIPTNSGDIERFFARDMARAIKRDIRGGEVGVTNGGDYRYDAQEFKITDLKFTRTTNRLGGVVTVSFKNFDKPETVTYAMCLARRGWRITDVRSTGGSMRDDLKLPSVPVDC